MRQYTWNKRSNSAVKLVGIILVLLTVGPCFAQDGFTAGHPALAYWKIGEKSPVVIVLHGGPAASHDYLRPEFDRLSESATLIYYDQRGSGQSEKGDHYTWQDHVGDLNKLIQIFSPRRKVFLVGSSWGSLLAIVYAYMYPGKVKGLILSGTVRWIGTGEKYSSPADVRYLPLHRQFIQEKRIVCTNGMNGAITCDTSVIKRQTTVSAGTPWNEPLSSFKSAPPADSLRKIMIPIAIINGAENRQYDWAEHYTKLFPNSESFIFPAAGHDPWLSNPELFATICTTFIGTHR